MWDELVEKSGARLGKVLNTKLKDGFSLLDCGVGGEEGSSRESQTGK